MIKHENTLAQLPRIPLANLPTPIVQLRRLAVELGGPNILMKRDDLTGLATGGNKTRKLEFLIAAARENSADCVITAGGAQSNHCRQTAAAAAITGMSCHLVLGGNPPKVPRGNLFLDALLGAQLHWIEKTRRNERMQSLSQELRAAGHRPFVIPIGGSNSLGAVGYVAAMIELAEQLATIELDIDEIYVATSSGGTLAGMLVGAFVTGYAGRIVGVSIDLEPDDQFESTIAGIASETARLLGMDHKFTANDVTLDYGYLGSGYGVVGDLEREAIRLVAQQEGVLLGPVYTSRAMGGLVDLIRNGKIDRHHTVLFWHTGDEAALHGYVEDLLVP